MKDTEIEHALSRATRLPHELDPALLDRIADSIKPSLQPVRAMPPSWGLIGGLLLTLLAVALAGAARAGFGGFESLRPLERLLIFGMGGALALATARAVVSQVVPGSRHGLSSSMLLGVSCACLISVFALLFHEYRSEHFVSAGVICLTTGLLHSIPIAALTWLILRRGFPVDPSSTAMAGGTLAGLGGLMMLELHCANFEALHVMVWHTAVVAVSGGCGALVGMLIARYRRGPSFPAQKPGATEL